MLLNTLWLFMTFEVEILEQKKRNRFKCSDLVSPVEKIEWKINVIDNTWLMPNNKNII